MVETIEAQEKKGDPLGPNCCVIRKYWGQTGVPREKIDYLDGIEFRGGVARDVPTELARKWEAKPGIGVYVLPAKADEGDFIKATGIKPMPVAQLAAMLSGYDLKQIADELGEELALKISNALRPQPTKK